MKKIILGLLILLATLSNSLYGQDINDFQWEMNDDNTITITKYIGNIKSVKIPSKIDGYTVTIIGEVAFAFNDLISVSIPDTIRIIGYQAFIKNKIRYLVVPPYVRIEGEAFRENELSILIIGHNTILKAGAFHINPLSYIELGYNVILGETLGITIDPNGPTIFLSAFNQSFNWDWVSEYNNNGRNGAKYELRNNLWIKNLKYNDVFDFRFLIRNSNAEAIITGYTGSETNVVIPTTISEIPVTHIGRSAFRRSNIVSVSLPINIKIIEYTAFEECRNLVSINIPSSIENIQMGAFHQCDKLAPNIITYLREKYGDNVFSALPRRRD